MEKSTRSEVKPRATLIADAWEEVRNSKPGIRIRDAAVLLNLSEAQLLAITVGTEAVRLNQNFSALLKRFPDLGRIMSLTRNDACILEHKGPFQKVNTFGAGDHQMGTVIGPVETRVFFKSWYVAFAVRQKKDERVLTSIQIFDHEGSAITKIYLQDNSSFDAFQKIVEEFKSDDQRKDQEVTQYPEETFNENADKEQLMRDWSALKDTHDFYPLLRKHRVDRYDAVVLAEGRYSYKILNKNLQPLLEKAAVRKLPVMIFAGNRGNLQIHQGIVRTIRMLDRGEQWLNVLDPDFNMHLRTDLISSSWVVIKPTADGEVTSIECYDTNNELVVQFFGLRKPGHSELVEWKTLVGEMEKV